MSHEEILLMDRITGALRRRTSAVVVAELVSSVVNFAVATNEWNKCCNLGRCNNTEVPTCSLSVTGPGSPTQDLGSFFVFAYVISSSFLVR